MAEGTNNLNFNLELLRTEISAHSRRLAWIFWSNIAIIVIAMRIRPRFSLRTLLVLVTKIGFSAVSAPLIAPPLAQG